jgi:hypothetical protein
VELPQPGWRILGAVSIAIGSGLYSASAQPGLLVLALAPAVLAISVIAIQSTHPRPDPAEIEREEDSSG